MPLNIKENVSLSPLTTLGIGGAARQFLYAENEDDVAAGLRQASDHGMPVFILGGGSNILVSDQGFDGLVMQIGLKGIDRKGSVVTTASGEDWDPFVAYCVDNDLGGVECMSGIPGFVGGTPVQNVGAYGQEVAETIVEVRCVDRLSGGIVTLSNADCGFTYRTSIFNTTDRDRYIVTAVTFDLTQDGKPKIAYRDLADRFDGKEATLREVREAVIEIRRAKSMVIDPSDPNSRSAGSFFKNAIVTAEKLESLKAELGKVPSFEFGDQFKIPAAWLIETAGFHKGFTMGNTGISSNHSLAIVNRGDAKASDIVALKDRIQSVVEEKFGIVLHPEPVFVGFDN
jgi:UDP-N-acetylmuramate dehydrogenase